MGKRVLAAVLAVLGIGVVNGLMAADPPPGEVLPPPRVVASIPGEGQIRFNRYAVWQAYDVDRFGQFRPVVVNSPWCAYYYANGAWFPWPTVYPNEFLRKRVGD